MDTLINICEKERATTLSIPPNKSKTNNNNNNPTDSNSSDEEGLTSGEDEEELDEAPNRLDVFDFIGSDEEEEDEEEEKEPSSKKRKPMTKEEKEELQREQREEEGFTSSPSIYNPFSQSFPPTTKFGPQQLAKNITTEADVFSLFFTNTLLSHLIERTNQYAKDHDKRLNPEESILSVTKQDILNYLALFFTMGLLRSGRKRAYWEKETTNSGIFCNSFFHRVMGSRKWCLIDRCLQVNAMIFIRIIQYL